MIHAFLRRGPDYAPEGTFLVEVLGPTSTPGFFMCRMKTGQILTVNQSKLVIQWVAPAIETIQTSTPNPS